MDKLHLSEKKVYSQNGEDGITLTLINIISKVHKLKKFFFEFGVEDGTECNTRILRNIWDGVILDGSHSNKKIIFLRRSLHMTIYGNS